eukprot:SAG11_NODE_18677_length_484_cov_0.761039_1_plen_58_part_01
MFIIPGAGVRPVFILPGAGVFYSMARCYALTRCGTSAAHLRFSRLAMELYHFGEDTKS